MSPLSEKKTRTIVLKVLTVLLLTIVFLGLISAFWLKKGVRLESFTLGQLSVSDISLVWRDKLELQIAKLTLLESKEKTKAGSFDIPAQKAYVAVRSVASLFSRFTIDEIKANDITGILYLVQEKGEESYFHLTSNDLALKSDINFNQNSFVIDITEASSKKFASEASGQLILDPLKGTLTGDLSANVGGSFPISLQFTADKKQMSFKGTESGEIRNITPLVDLFGLSHNIQRWITEYLHGSRYNLKTFSGSGTWNDPITFLHNLYAEVRVDNCEYTFAPGLEPIKTKYTDVTFSKGVLIIKPHDSTFYGQDCEDSWLDINFNTPSDILLTAYITTHARANKDILTLLKYYKIGLPFIQTKGKTAVDLTLAIHLGDINIAAQGTFHIDKGTIQFNQESLNVTNVSVTLANSDITIEEASVDYQGVLTAKLSGLIRAGNGGGTLNAEIMSANLPIGQSTLTIDQSEPHPKLEYHLLPDVHRVDAQASSWKLDDTKIKLGPFSTPFTLDELSANLPPVLLTIPPGISANVSGYASITRKQLELQCDLFKYQVKDLTLETPHAPIAITFDKTLTIRHKKTSKWLINTIPTTLYPSEFKYSKNVVTVVDGRISYGTLLDSHVSGHFDHKLRLGSFFLEDLDIKSEFLNQQLDLGSGLTVDVSTQDEGLIIDIPDLDLNIRTNEDSKWSATFTDLATLHSRSAILQQYKIDAGSLTISSKNGKHPYDFSAEIPNVSPVLIKDNNPVDHYEIKGIVTGQGVTASVNEGVNIEYKDQLTVTSKDFGFNLPAILALLKTASPTKQPTGSKDQPKLNYSMEAVNSSLYLNANSSLPADTIQLSHTDGKTTMQLIHGPGTIDLEVEGNFFSCKGNALNDVFMSALAPTSDFQNGNMSIAAQGSFNQFSALFKITDTILKDFKALNNIMAFINTIPALITFSRPEYSSEGLPVSSAILGLTMNEGIATVESLSAESTALSITGTGSIDFPQKKIDMTMNLISSAKTNMSKIPLVGYVLVGDEKRPSITLNITGDLQSPEVTNSMYRDVAKTPFSMLYRTLKLPSRLVNSMDDTPDPEENKQNETDN